MGNSWLSSTESPSTDALLGLHVVENADNIQAGDYLLGHPMADGISGCVAIVLRHSPLDTLCLLLNIDADGGTDNVTVQDDAQNTTMAGYVQSPWHPRRVGQMPRRPHIHLPPIASED